jgi:uncharacterized protein YjaZ
MNERSLILIITILFSFNLSSQIAKTENFIRQNPEDAIIITADIDNFWASFDMLESYKGNPFEEFYVKRGSDGVKNFLNDNRIVNADTLRATVLRRKQDYINIRKNTLEVKTIEKQCRSTYYALKYLYPKTIFPPLYFVIGRFNTGGLSIPSMQIIGTEMNSPENIPFIVAHELVHAQQNIPYKYKILLEQCIIEGSADFIGELISGKVSSRAAYEYAIGKDKLLWEDFLKDMNLGENDNFANWLYAGDRKDERPADMGYYIGYVITKAYYNKAKDKRKAIEEILNIKDCKQFLADSGYNPS